MVYDTFIIVILKSNAEGDFESIFYKIGNDRRKGVY
jgi:hypothetical protein